MKSKVVKTAQKNLKQFIEALKGMRDEGAGIISYEISTEPWETEPEGGFRKFCQSGEYTIRLDIYNPTRDERRRRK